MKRFGLILIILVLSSVMMMMMQYSFALSASEPIKSYGTIVTPSGQDTFKDVLYAGGMTADPDTVRIESGETRTQYIAKFDMLITDPPFAQYLPKIRALNNDIIMLVYVDIIYGRSSWWNWDTVWANETWFKHYTSGGKIIGTDGKSYLMDIGNEGYREYVAVKCNYYLDAGFDGIFMDNTWSSFEWSLPQWAHSSDIPAWTTFHQDMMGLLQHVKSKIGTKLLVPNGSGTDYASVTDGKCNEDFPKWFNAPTRTQAMNDIDEMSQLSANNKIYYTCSYSYPVGSQETLDDMLYCMTGYLLGLNGPRVYFGWNNIWTVEQGIGTSRGYFPIFEDARALGEPTGAYYSTQSVYARDFQHGKVFFNPSSTSRTVSLGGTFRDPITNQQVTQILVPAWSGRIVTRT